MSPTSPQLPLDKLSLGDAPMASPASVAAPGPAVPTDAELERFRAEWRREVAGRRRGESKAAPGSIAAVDAVPPACLTEHEAARLPRSPTGKDSALPRVRTERSPVLPAPALPIDLDDAPPQPYSPPSASSSALPSARTHRSANPPVRDVLGVRPPSAAQIAAASGTTGAIPFVRGRVRGSEPGAGAGAGAERGPGKDRAVQLYARAVESEQSGQLNDALRLYRQAFKLDDSVDRLYARAIAQTEASALETVSSGAATPTSADVVSASAPSDAPYEFARHIQVLPDYERVRAARVSPLTALLAARCGGGRGGGGYDALEFVRDDEHLPAPIARVPPELFDAVFAHLDVGSVERFARACWRARQLTAQAAVWRRAAEAIYRPPAMLPPGRHAGDLVRRHAGEWRTTLVEEERVRMDGCYISVCHYM
ncbi:hypothetical protein Q5752_003767 [Cryptotrichosporon argae]